MMFDSVLVKVSCSEELLYLHTISRRHKSPYRFAILRDTLEQLEREPGRQIIVADCGCYAALRLTRALDGEMLVIRFSWLQSAGADSLRGYEEWVRLPYRRFHECVEAGTDMAGWTAIVNLSGLHGASRRIGVLAGAVRWRNLASQNKRKNCVPAGQGNWIAVYFPQSLIHPALFADIYMSVSAHSSCAA